MNAIAIKELLRGTEISDWTILAGCGVSAPSGLPLGLAFMEQIIKSLTPSLDAANELLRLCEPSAKGKSWLRFEGLIEILQELVDSNLCVLDTFGEGMPNSNHNLLAHFAKNGALVFTTNFDTLIEKAYVNLVGKSASLWYECPSNLPKHGVLTIHGTLRTYNKESETWETSPKTNPAVTLRTVGQTRNSPWAVQFEHAINSRHLLVVGYSGLDDFDIIRCLRQRKDGKKNKTLWVLHEQDDLKKNVVDHISSLQKSSSHRHRPLMELYDVLLKSAKSYAEEFYYATGDTNSILKQFKKKFLPSVVHKDDPGNLSIEGSERFEGIFNKWVKVYASPLPEWKKHLFTGTVLKSLHLFKRAVSYLKSAVEGTSIPQDRFIALCYLGEAEGEITTGSYRNNAVKHCKEALHISKNIQSFREQIHLTLGRVLFYLGKYKDAEKYLRPIDDKNILTDSLGLRMFIEWCRTRSRLIMSKPEPKLCQIILNDLSKAKDFAKKLGELEMEALTSQEIAKWNVFWNFSDKSKENIGVLCKSIEAMKNAARLYSHLGTLRKIPAVTIQIAGWYMKKADWISWEQDWKIRPNLQEALEACYEALNDAIRAESLWEEGMAHLCRSVLHFRNGDMDIAAEALRRAEDAGTRSGRYLNRDKARVKHQTGLIHFVNGDMEGALKEFAIAKELAKSDYNQIVILSEVAEYMIMVYLQSRLAVNSIRRQLERSINSLQSPYHERRIRILLQALNNLTLKELRSKPWILVDSRP